MDSIFSIYGLTFKEANLLFCLEKEIIENDISFSQQNKDKEGKKIWLFYWKKGINDLFRRLMELAPIEKLSLENIDKLELYNEVSDQVIHIGTSWNDKMFERCYNFMPYNWIDLMGRDKNEADNLLLHQRVYPNLTLNEKIKEETLDSISALLSFGRILY